MVLPTRRVHFREVILRPRCNWVPSMSTVMAILRQVVPVCMAAFGSPIVIPGTGTNVPGIPTGGAGGGFGTTLGGTRGNSTGDLTNASGSGNANAAGFGAGEATSFFGNAGGSGGGATSGYGSGVLAPLATPVFGMTSFNGTGGGTASGFAGAFVGIDPPTPNFSFIPLGP